MSWGLAAEDKNGPPAEDAGRETSYEGEDLVVCGEKDGTHVHAQHLSEYEGCEVILPFVGLERFPHERIEGLESMIRADSGMNVTRSDHLTSLTGLSSLRSVGGNLQVAGLDVSSLAGLDNLREVEGNCVFSDFQEVYDLQGLGNLERCGDLAFGLIPIATLSDLENLRLIDGDLSFRRTELPDAAIRQFLERVQINGTVTVDGEIWEMK